MVFLECVVCKLPFNCTVRRPKRQECGHILCFSCAELAGVKGDIACPICKHHQPYNGPESLLDDEDALKVLSRSAMQCVFHADKEATKFCMTQCIPICDLCLKACERCAVEEIVPWRVRSHLLSYLHRLVAHYGEVIIPLKVREDYSKFNSASSETFSISEVFSVFRQIVKSFFVTVCDKCSSSNYEFINVQSMELLCRRCWPSPPSEYLLETHDEEYVRSSVRRTLIERLKSIHASQLTYTQIAWLHQHEDSFRDFLQTAFSIQELSITRRWDLPEYFFCPGCGSMYRKRCHSLRVLPCEGACHFICTNCWASARETVTCPLDRKEYYLGRPLQLVENLQDPETDTPQHASANCPATMPTLAVESAIEERRVPRIRSEGHFLTDKGIPMPTFSPDRGLFVLERYIRVFPDPSVSVESFPLAAPWLVNRHKHQVEAFSFSCFRKACLWGLGLANPVEGLVTVQWVRLYEGRRGSGTYTDCELETNQLVGGASVVTDIYFRRPVSLQGQAPYTVKLQLDSVPPGHKVAIYHGNHIGMLVDAVGSDQTAWDYLQTAGVEHGEKNSGQHDLISPLLRLIYS